MATKDTKDTKGGGDLERGWRGEGEASGVWERDVFFAQGTHGIEGGNGPECRVMSGGVD